MCVCVYERESDIEEGDDTVKQRVFAAGDECLTGEEALSQPNPKRLMHLWPLYATIKARCPIVGPCLGT